MSRLPRPAARARAALVALCAAGCTITPLSEARRQDALERARLSPPSASSAAPSPTAARPAPFAWPGTYDVIGSDFPEGERRAVITVVRRDTGYVFTVDGPPGWVAASRVDADSAAITWEFGSGNAPPMGVWLRGRGDSLTGTWAIGTQLGPLRGRRRP